MSISDHFEYIGTSNISSDLDNVISVTHNHVRRTRVNFLGAAAYYSVPLVTFAYMRQARMYLRNAYCELSRSLRDLEEQKNKGRIIYSKNGRGR
jgi:hypothetical protein